MYYMLVISRALTLIYLLIYFLLILIQSSYLKTSIDLKMSIKDFRDVSVCMFVNTLMDFILIDIIHNTILI